MSASPVSVPFLVVSNPASSRVLTMPDPATRLVKRRPGKPEGQALEVLGHALEYLVDTRMFIYKQASSKADGEAIQILSRCSREVFAACPEVVPFGARLRGWLGEHFHLRLGPLHSARRKA